ncbi:MAG: hypothetical protein RI988_2969, partial [Pseudomonadota bacterium]
MFSMPRPSLPATFETRERQFRSKNWTETVPPVALRFVSDLDPAFMQQVLD